MNSTEKTGVGIGIPQKAVAAGIIDVLQLFRGPLFATPFTTSE
jgi:hypothetical protein